VRRLAKNSGASGGLSRPSYDSALWALHTWLDSWSAWRVAVGMASQGFDLQLTRYDERGWPVTFYMTRMEHSPTSAMAPAGSARRGARRKRAAWER
jgi:hypothetical protein